MAGRAGDPRDGGPPASAVPAGVGDGPAPRARVDAWTWAVRLFPTRSAAGAACRAGHVRVNDERAKPATAVTVGDEVRVRAVGRDRVVVVTRVVARRVGAAVAVECYADHSPAPVPRDVLSPLPRRDRGAGRPTKRDRRRIEQLRGRDRPSP